MKNILNADINRRKLLLSSSIIGAGYSLLSPKSLAASNVIQLENAKTGTAGWGITNYSTYFDWSTNTLGIDPYPEIEGYASSSSVNAGDSLSFFINTPESLFTLKIFRLGWYNGIGARQISSIVLPGKIQNIPTPDSLGKIECNWVESYNIIVPSDWISGIYLVKLIAETSGKQSYITFVVREDNRSSTYLFQSASNTSQAYNNWGGKSLYEFNSKNALKAKVVSFNRPEVDRVGAGEVLNWEVQMLRFLEREGYDVSYIANIDIHTNPTSLLQHKSFLSVGHDEYWSYQMKAGVQAAQAAGVHIGFFSANTSYWQVRFSSGVNGPNRSMTCYKELAINSDPFSTDVDKTNDKFITSQYRDLPSVGVIDTVARPENAMIGVMYHGDPVNGDIVVYDPSHWIFTGTGVVKGTRFTGLLGYETDSIFNNGYSPVGLRKLTESPDNFGFSHSTIFTSSSGSSTFATGSMQWSWGLDDYPSWAPNSNTGNHVSSVVQQVTKNILARFAGPALLAPNNIVTSPGNTQVSLSWNTVQNAITYDVFRSLTAGGEDIIPYKSGLTIPSFTDTGLQNGTQYFYQIIARNGFAESQPSIEVNVIPVAGNTLPTPLNILATAGNTVVVLSWSAVQGATSYDVYSSTSTGTEVLFTNVTVLTYTNTGITNGIKYFYKIVAKNGSISSPFSAEVSATPTAVTLLAPTKLTGYSCDVGCWINTVGIRINWTQSTSPGITTNTVQRGLAQAGPFTNLATIPANIVYVDGAVTKGVNYFYRIIANNAAGASSPAGNITAVTF